MPVLLTIWLGAWLALAGADPGASSTPTATDASGRAAGTAYGGLASDSGTPARIDVVFLGDSHFERWNVEQAFAPLRVLNRGIWGQTSEQILQRFYRDVVQAQPRSVVVIAGANDMLADLPLAVTKANLQAMLEQSAEHALDAYLATIPPARAGDEVGEAELAGYNSRVRELNDWIRAMAPALGATTVDVYELLVDDSGKLDGRYGGPDGLHLNDEGYQRIGQLLRPLLLGTASSQSAGGS